MGGNYLDDAFDLLDSIGVMHADSRKMSTLIKKSESRLGLVFPEEYKKFITRYGCVVQDDLVFFGLGAPRYRLPNVESAYLLALSFCQGAPETLLPFHMLRKGVFASLDCSSHSKKTKVVLWDTSEDFTNEEPPTISESFGEYIYRIITEKIQRDNSFRRLEKYVDDFTASHKYSHAEGGKLPSNHEWRPYRYCIQDVLFGSVVVQHDRKFNRLNVDVFLTADIPEYDPLAPTQALTAFLLSEAYKCGGSMEIQFTEDGKPSKVPTQIQDLATRYSLSIENHDNGRITSQEAKNLYIAVTGFSESFKERLSSMEADGLIRMSRVCYVVHHGVWSREQVEMIVLGSEHPDRILSGASAPNQRHLFQNDLLYARSAVMGGILDRALTLRTRPESEDTAFELEDDFRPITLGYDGISNTREILCEEELKMPWLVGVDDVRFIPAGIKTNILIRARDSLDMKRHLFEDLSQAITLRNKTQVPTFILVPFDFQELGASDQQNILEKFNAAQIGLMVSPETTISMDAEVTQKLAQSRILRQ